MKGNKLRVAILISGGGTTMARVIHASKTEQLPYVEVVCVVASNENAGGIPKALALGIKVGDVLVRPRSFFSSTEQFGDTLIAEFKLRGVDFVAQMGWLPKTPAHVIDAFGGMMSNQHPGPLRYHHRDFGGKGMYGCRVHAARLNFIKATNRNFWTEAVCQQVHKEFDQGGVFKSRRVPVLPDDDVKSLQERVLPIEHEVQIAALHDVCMGRAVVKVVTDDLVLPGEEPILQKAKADAIRDWPNG